MMDNGMAAVAFGPGHWLVFIVMLALILYPIGRILSRLGFSPFWSVVAVIPFINLIGLWALAFGNWPGERAALKPEER